MIKQIFKIIWNERGINSWIVAELILIFTILWFCNDYLYLVGSRYVEPLGFDITNTYQVKIGIVSPSIVGEISEEDKTTALEDVIKRLKSNPQVENASLSLTALPYSGSFNGGNYKIDSDALNLWNKRVNADFFDVFKIKFLQGHNFTPNELINDNALIIGYNKTGLLNDKIDILSVDSLYVENNKKTDKVVGIADKIKRSEFESYGSIVYEPITEIGIIKDYFWGMEIAMRVKPEADTKEFGEKFVKEMRPQLDIKPFFLIDISPLSEARNHYFGMTGTVNNIRSTSSILLFLLVNISLGIIGTFWLRIEARRSEIGVQMALGASRRRIKKTYIIEAIFLLLIASIIGSIIAINIQATDILDNVGLPMISGNTAQKEISLYKLFVNYSLTFTTLVIIIIASVWYPSQRASRTKPASVLRGE